MIKFFIVYEGLDKDGKPANLQNEVMAAAMRIATAIHAKQGFPEPIFCYPENIKATFLMNDIPFSLQKEIEP